MLWFILTLQVLQLVGMVSVVCVTTYYLQELSRNTDNLKVLTNKLDRLKEEREAEALKPRQNKPRTMHG